MVAGRNRPRRPTHRSVSWSRQQAWTRSWDWNGQGVRSKALRRSEDALRLHELHAASVRALCAKHYASEIIEGWLQSRTLSGYLAPIERAASFVAELNHKIIGFGEATAGAIVAVYVDPSATGQG